MDIKRELDKIGLNPNNTIVVSSGILNTLNIRKSKDIDVVVTDDIYIKLLNKKGFRKEAKFDRELLVNDLFDISTDWFVLGKSWNFEDFREYSIIINGVRYITIEFLLNVKKSWIAGDEVVRQKDIDDVKLIEDYLEKNSS